MSYNYFINPTIEIHADNLKPLLWHLGVARIDQAVTELNNKGYLSSIEVFEEDGYQQGITVHHLGKVPEYLGIDGIVAQFNKFLEDVNRLIVKGDYRVTDEYGVERIIAVA